MDVVKDQCDVLILSASYGGGHNQVARALTQAMMVQMPGIKVATVNFTDLLIPFFTRLSRFGYMQSIRHFPEGYALYYQATGNLAPDSFWQRRLNRMGYSELILLVNRLQPRVIISTFPLPAGVLSQMKEAGDLNVPVVTVITDMAVHNQWIHANTDLYIVGSPEVASGLMGRGVPRNRIGVTGIPILPAFNLNRSREELLRKFDLNLADSRARAPIVHFMGGSDGIFGTTRFSRILRDLPPETQTLVITGGNHELFERLQPYHEKYPNFRPLQFVEDVAGLMELADLLVTKAGGISISEALAKGLPMVIYKPLPGHEEANANFLWRHHAAIIAKSERRLRTAILRMVNDERFRQHFQHNCLKIGHPGSAEAAARMILNMLVPATREVKRYSAQLRSEIRA